MDLYIIKFIKVLMYHILYIPVVSCTFLYLLYLPVSYYLFHYFPIYYNTLQHLYLTMYIFLYTQIPFHSHISMYVTTPIIKTHRFTHFCFPLQTFSKIFSTFILMPISYLGFNLFNDSLISIIWISLTPKNNRPIAIFCMTGLQKKFVKQICK